MLRMVSMSSVRHYKPIKCIKPTKIAVFWNFTDFFSRIDIIQWKCKKANQSWFFYLGYFWHLNESNELSGSNLIQTVHKNNKNKCISIFHWEFFLVQYHLWLSNQIFFTVKYQNTIICMVLVIWMNLFKSTEFIKII